MGGKIIVIFVTISIIGTLNGLIMASIRQPYSLAIRGMLPRAETIAKINKRINMPLYSGITALAFTLLWFAVHFILLKSKVSGFDISEISITLNYVLFGFIYARVLQCGIKKKINLVNSSACLKSQVLLQYMMQYISDLPCLLCRGKSF